jgi:hypothetical protein
MAAEGQGFAGEQGLLKTIKVDAANPAKMDADDCAEM